jgi:hypothetical protein
MNIRKPTVASKWGRWIGDLLFEIRVRLFVRKTQQTLTMECHIRELEKLVDSMAERIAAQSEILSRRSEPSIN